MALFLIQPLIGTWHHQLYKANRPSKLLRYGHIWFGRFLIALGMIQGGIGLWLAANSPGGEKVYGALAGIIGVTYIALVVFWHVSKGMATKDVGDEMEKRSDSSDAFAGEERK